MGWLRKAIGIDSDFQNWIWIEKMKPPIPSSLAMFQRKEKGRRRK